MTIDRRFLLRSLLATATVVSLPRALLAATRPEKAFQATAADSAITELFGAMPQQSDAVSMKIPDIAENGAVVPVTVSTDLPDVESISVVVDNNPTPLTASFQMSPRMAPTVSLRIKMGQSSNVRAIVKTSSGLFNASKEVKVTIGGCGG
jgi:sulfur-oxidizing protein SoxY